MVITTSAVIFISAVLGGNGVAQDDHSAPFGNNVSSASAGASVERAL